MIAIGDQAPDFSLHDQNNELFTLSDYRGHKAVLLVFYPLAFTGICSGELGEINVRIDQFQNDAVQTVTVSVDSVYTHKVFADREGFEFPLLSDFWPHGGVAQRYGVFNESAGIANRGTFLIDRDGVVRFAECNGPGDGRDANRWQDAIAAL